MWATSTGYIVHWKSSTQGTVWEYCTAEHNENQLVKIYTSKLIRAGNYSEEQTRKILDYLITCIGDKARETDGIVRMDITRNNDIVICYNSEELAEALINEGKLIIEVHHPDPVLVPCGPVTTEGLVNHSNYAIQCRNPPIGLPIVSIIEAL